MTDEPEISPPQHPDDADEEMPFLVVGVGASAGGLEAIGQLLRPLPDDTRMAFVVVTHQADSRQSMLPELLDRECPLPVTESADGVEIEPGHVYVAAPGSHLAVEGGRLRHRRRDGSGHPPRPVDALFRSLAAEYGERTVAIVLSGSGSDGTLGCREVKGVAGLVLAEDPTHAGHAGMPQAVVDAGLADHVLPPAAMVDMLCGYAEIRRPAAPQPVAEIDDRVLSTVLESVYARTGRDFRHYKESTLRRRIAHRMAIQQVERPDRYVKFLLADDDEVDRLFRDLLIGVTSFFREPEAWRALGAAVAEHLLDQRPRDVPVRAWVPGCSTGEEAYSLAMLLHERIEAAGLRVPVSIFATDLDEDAITSARYGTFPDAAAADIGEERTARFFRHADGELQASRTIRNMLVFAPHDLLSNPPFTRLDLVSCRNVLIYLRPEMQEQLLRLLHYALKPGGLLFLGSSESEHAVGGLFEPLDRTHKLYRRAEGPGHAHPSIPLRPVLPRPGTKEPSPPRARELSDSRIGTLVESALADLYAPVAALVNDRGDVFYLHGRTGLVLEPVRGKPRNSLLAMAREGLEPALAAALREAAEAGEGEVVRRNVRVKTNGDHVLIDLTVRRIEQPQPLRGLLLVAFRQAAPRPPVPSDGERPSADRETELEQDLQFTRESLQATVEELEISNEELRSSMEELQSTNEELQSANEELEASKEELESLNEELTTVNNELQTKVEELSEANDDVVNLLDSTDIATLFLDERLRIKRFSERATGIIRLIGSDVGRHLSDLSTALVDGDLVGRCERVLRTLAPVEDEVSTADDRRVQMRILPYRTVDGAVDGVVLTFVDITAVRRAEERARRRAAEERSFLEAMVRRPLAVLDPELRVVMCNLRFAKAFGVAPGDEGEVEGRPVTEGHHGVWDRSELRAFLEEVLHSDGDEPVETRSTVVSSEDGRTLEVEARQLQLVGREGSPDAHLIVALRESDREAPADG